MMGREAMGAYGWGWEVVTTTEQTEQGDATAARRAVQATIAELRGHNAQLVRQQEMLLQERDDLARRLDEEHARCEVTVAQWRQRCEESLEAQLELAARLNAALQRIADAPIELTAALRGDVARLEGEVARLEGGVALDVARLEGDVTRLRNALDAKGDDVTRLRDTLIAKNAHIVRLESLVREHATQLEDAFAAKNAHIAHLESLLGGSPRSLVGAWLATRRRHRRREATPPQSAPHASA